MAAAAPATTSSAMAGMKRKAPEPDADRGSSWEMCSYLLSETQSSAVRLLQDIAAEAERDRWSEEKALADELIATREERWAAILAMDAELGMDPAPVPPFPELDPEQFDDPDFFILRPEDYQERKRRMGNDGLVRYYVHE